MAKKRNFDERWEGAGFYDFPYLSKRQFRELAKVLGIRSTQLGHAVRQELQDAIRDYASDRHIFSKRLRPAEIKASLSEVIKKTTALLDTLKRADYVTLQSLNLRLEFDLLEKVRQIVSATTDVSKLLETDRGGRPAEKAPLRGLIRRLAGLFQYVTKSKPSIYWDRAHNRYKSRFFNFVHACLVIVNPVDIWSNNALGKQILKALQTPLNNDDLLLRIFQSTTSDKQYR